MSLLASRLEAWLNARWYGNRGPGRVLRGLACLHGALAARRRGFWARRAWRAPVPVVVVGNVSVGGTGKTPLTSWLARELEQQGLKVGIVSRGYGRQRGGGPETVTPQTAVSRAGDEPLLLARETGCPVVVGRNRPAACRHLLENHSVDVLLSDDGLQHYPLARQLEIAVLDAERGLGNARLLPAGPLREPPKRLEEVDFLVWNGGAPVGAEGLSMELESRDAVRLQDGERRSLAEFSGQRVWAVAGIGNPERFFKMLSAHGICWEPIRPGDHARLDPDWLGGGPEPVLMTDKDAVKLEDMGDPRLWRVPAQARLPDGQVILERIRELVESRS